VRIGVLTSAAVQEETVIGTVRAGVAAMANAALSKVGVENSTTAAAGPLARKKWDLRKEFA
jgi:hypothetical protein